MSQIDLTDYIRITLANFNHYISELYKRRNDVNELDTSLCSVDNKRHILGYYKSYCLLIIQYTLDYSETVVPEIKAIIRKTYQEASKLIKEIDWKLEQLTINQLTQGA